MSLDQASLEKELNQLNNQLADPKVFGQADYPQMAKRQKQLQTIISLIKEQAKLQTEIQSVEQLISQDSDLNTLGQQEITTLKHQLRATKKKLNQQLKPPDERDHRAAIVEIRAGVGGDEAALFAGDLFRMYARFGDKHNYQLNIISQTTSSSGGFKEVIFEVDGRGAFGQLKLESGVHRVQRIPATEASGRIHTSTATVAIMAPTDEKEIEINPGDLKIETFRSSGHGGQSVNTTDSAVRITHLPTGLVVSCQNERSQLKNRQQALGVLRAKLKQHSEAQTQKDVAQTRQQLIGRGERNEKIRTYNFPQDRLTDHRINYSQKNLKSVLDGNLDQLIAKLQP